MLRLDYLYDEVVKAPPSLIKFEKATNYVLITLISYLYGNAEAGTYLDSPTSIMLLEIVLEYCGFYIISSSNELGYIKLP